MRVYNLANTPARIGGDGAEECVTRTIAYVSNAESKEIFAFDMDPESGALSLLERKPVPGTDLPSPTSLPMAVSPDHRFLYAALRSPPFAASSFGIDPSSGRLSHLAVTPLLPSTISTTNVCLSPLRFRQIARSSIDLSLSLKTQSNLGSPAGGVGICSETAACRPPRRYLQCTAIE
jgi:6-phosphogluconolactonase (cycloisomerase 2 family)